MKTKVFVFTIIQWFWVLIIFVMITQQEKSTPPFFFSKDLQGFVQETEIRFCVFLSQKLFSNYKKKTITMSILQKTQGRIVEGQKNAAPAQGVQAPINS